MAGKVLNSVVFAIGAIVVAVLGLILVYVIGYGLFAMFGHSGMGTTGRGIGSGIVLILTLLALVLYFRSRRTTRVGKRQDQRNRAA